jgi:hypothetical protein
MGAPVLATYNQYPGGKSSALNLTAAAVIKATPGVLYRLLVNAPGGSSGAFALSDASGLVTAQTITGISLAAQAVVTLSTGGSTNPFAVGNTITFSSVGSAMGTFINPLVGTVTAVGGATTAWTVTTNISTLGQTAWASGGTAQSYNANNLVWELAYNATANVEGAAFTLDWPFQNGILLSAVPGGSPIASASYF